MRLFRFHALSGVFALLGAIALCSGCDPTFAPPSGPSAEGWYPLQQGRSWTFAVDTIHYREIGGNDTAHWEVREQLGAPFADLTGGTSYVLERYRRADSSLPWRYLATANVRWANGQLQRQDNNLNTIKLVGTMQSGQSWNGHIPLADLSSIPTAESCNNWRFLEGWTYRYSNLDSTVVLTGMVLDSVLTVRQAGEQNLIEHNDGFERYARGIGMVERSFRHLTTQTICPECPWEEKTECGFAVHEALIDWSK